MSGPGPWAGLVGEMARPGARLPSITGVAAPIIVATQAICIMIRYLFAARMLPGFRCSNRMRA